MNNISKFRELRNISQRELARYLKVSCSAVAMWETEARKPSITMAKRIADYFDSTIEQIFFDNRANETLANNVIEAT